jgi:beta-xylosidase
MLQLAAIALLIPSLAGGSPNVMKMKPAERATNPILWADMPDPSIVRVGSDYYMSSTTMNMNPGVPILKSSDLSNWRIVSYAHEALGDNDAFNLANGKNAYGKGSWASSIRFHKGTFYVSTFSATTGKTHIFKTRDPEQTPWEAQAFAPSFHDNSLFFDDDERTYLVHGAGDIRLVEIEPDLSGVKNGGVDRVIVRNATAVAGGTPGLPAEGSQLFKINGYYYLVNITWPRNDMRTAIVHRAERIEGPYEGRVLFHDRGIAQGGFIDTPDGKWYAYFFRDSGAVGRIPWLVPMKWEAGWPVVGVDGKAPDVLDDLPENALGVSGLVSSDGFDRKAGERPLPLAWQWNHNPDPADWSLSERAGYLRLRTSRVDSSVVEAKNTLTQRTFGPTSAASTAIETAGLKDGDVAGMVALMGRYGFVGVKRVGSDLRVIMESVEGNGSQEVASVKVDGERVYLAIECDFRDGKDEAKFLYSLDGKEWQPIGNVLKLRYDLRHFMGCRFGLFAFSTKNPGGHADFDFFRIGKTLTSLEAK